MHVCLHICFKVSYYEIHWWHGNFCFLVYVILSTKECNHNFPGKFQPGLWVMNLGHLCLDPSRGIKWSCGGDGVGRHQLPRQVLASPRLEGLRCGRLCECRSTHPTFRQDSEMAEPLRWAGECTNTWRSTLAEQPRGPWWSSLWQVSHRRVNVARGISHLFMYHTDLKNGRLSNYNPIIF